tara:strand:- start:1291 stop:1671 length:381 start_codon:yes stop_codon:yes gene_type:complete
MSKRYYTNDHEWVAIPSDNAEATIGITQYAVDELGDIVYVELPEIGQSVQQGDEIGTVESVKTVSSIYAPLSGNIVRTNTELSNRPDIINEAPDSDGWMVVIAPTNADELSSLLSPSDYQHHCDTL